MHLLHGVGRGVGVIGLRRGIAGQEVERCFLIAHVRQYGVTDLHGDRQDRDFFLLDEVRWHVACRINHDAYPHIVPRTPRFSAPTVPQLPRGCMWQSGMGRLHAAGFA